MLIHKFGHDAKMLDDMFPWEREVWVHLLMEQLKKEKQEQDNQ